VLNCPTLYKRTSTGKIQMWEISVRDFPAQTVNGTNMPARASIFTLYGQVDGKKQTAEESISVGKNIGKANETTPFQQAEAEARSQWEQKIKKGYVPNLDDAKAGNIDTNVITGGVNPMLAHKYDEQGHKIKYPAYVQPKLDGHRCIAIIQDGKCTLWSRTRKPITGVPHIARALERLYGKATVVLDGELYNHDYREKFEQLTSFIRQQTPKPGHEVVQYWIYDTVVDGDFASRTKQLEGLASITSTTDPIVVVDTQVVDSEAEMTNLFGVYINFGFEGLMVRNSAGKYVGKRSYDLQKVKLFTDAEFEVVAVEEGRGKMAGHAMFVVKTGDKTFRVKMMGKLDDLKTMYDNREQYLGKMLTVKYQKLSAEGIPIFPVAVRFREDV
jgi:DNA ligase-1